MARKISEKFPGKKILVADDYPVNQEITKEMLKLMDCDVDVAVDGVEAVKMYDSNKYDLIFMDVQMPEMDGYDATRKIRDVEGGQKRIPIVAITANALQGDKQKCLDSGMDDYISKPIKAENIEQVLIKFFKEDRNALQPE